MLPVIEYCKIIVLWSTTIAFCHGKFSFVRGGADKSWAQIISRCSMMESIVSLERGVCSYDELQDMFLVTEPERKHVRRCSLLQHRNASRHSFPLKAWCQMKFPLF
jgi:hypothetical protein